MPLVFCSLPDPVPQISNSSNCPQGAAVSTRTAGLTHEESHHVIGMSVGYTPNLPGLQMEKLRQTLCCEVSKRQGSGANAGGSERLNLKAHGLCAVRSGVCVGVTREHWGG